jgi:uncharacterized protein (DUF362 family)
VNPETGNNHLNRRQFLARSARSGAAIAVACAAGFWFYDARGPDGPNDNQSDLRLPDYSIAGFGRKISIVRGADRGETLPLALKSLGGIETFIQRDDRVLLKVNAAFASPPMLSATTHPDIVAAMVQLCFKAGAISVVVTDNPINDPNSCFALSGIADAARRAGAAVLLPKEEMFKRYTVPSARLIRNWPVLYESFRGITKVIGLAPVKDHHRSGASMVMKNWYGLLGGRRNIFHQDIHTIITELAMMIKPTLVILDGTTTMMTNGPTGGSLSDLKQTNTLIAGTDPVAVDAFGATLLGKSLSDLPYIRKAETAGVGTADYRSLNPAMVSI